MEIKIENVRAAFNAADENGKKLLLALFPELNTETAYKPDNRPVTEWIKTFEDACDALGLVGEELIQKWEDEDLEHDEVAYKKLTIICAALNEDWEPQFAMGETRYYPWFWLYTQEEIDNMDEEERQDCRMISTGDYQTEYAGFAFAYSSYAPSDADSSVGSRLCLKSDTLAVYCGKQFIDIWADFNLIRRR